MSKYVVIVFPDEAKADEAVNALRELHDERSITLYGSVIARRDTSGALQPATLLDEVSRAFAEEITRRMGPGTIAVFAEVSERWTAPIDVRMHALGGDVIRESHLDTVDDLLGERLKAHRAEVDKRTAARETRKAEDMEARYEVAIEEARANLQRTADRARRRLDDTTHEVHEKLQALHRQAEKAKPRVREHIEQHISELSAEFAERERKLSHAFALAQEALQPLPVS